MIFPLALMRSCIFWNMLPTKLWTHVSAPIFLDNLLKFLQWWYIGPINFVFDDFPCVFNEVEIVTVPRPVQHVCNNYLIKLAFWQGDLSSRKTNVLWSFKWLNKPFPKLSVMFIIHGHITFFGRKYKTFFHNFALKNFQTITERLCFKVCIVY